MLLPAPPTSSNIYFSTFDPTCALAQSLFRPPTVRVKQPDFFEQHHMRLWLWEKKGILADPSCRDSMQLLWYSWFFERTSGDFSLYVFINFKRLWYEKKKKWKVISSWDSWPRNNKEIYKWKLSYQMKGLDPIVRSRVHFLGSVGEQSTMIQVIPIMLIWVYYYHYHPTTTHECRPMMLLVLVSTY